jgi:hypothetical protein
MDGVRRQWLAIETFSGRKIVTEKLSDGMVTWEEQPANCQHARIVRSSQCYDVKLSELQAFSRSARNNDVSNRCYAEQGFSLALREPPDAKSEPSVQQSHSGGARIEFSIDRFRQFDMATVSVESVEPVDQRYRRFGGRCLLLRNVLTADECTFLMKEMEGTLEPVRYREDYRKNDRCIFDSHELSELLYNRIKPFAQGLAVEVERDFSEQHVVGEEPGECPEELRLGLGMEGIWHPSGLNNCLRFCKYSAGGFFRKHCDAMFQRSEDEQSLFTCMFYLNGDLDGGATRFLHFDCPLDGDALERAKDKDVLASVPPEAGLCILFYQKGLLHEGEDLHSGVKYILRTDMMFRRDPTTKIERTAQEAEAWELLKQAKAAEERGGKDNFELAIQLYRRAFKLDSRLERLV